MVGNTEVKDNSGGLNNATNGHYLAVKPWTSSFIASEKSFGTTLVWIRISGLNIWCYHQNAMMRIAEAIGKPIKCDYFGHETSDCVQKEQLPLKQLRDTKSQSFEFGNGNKTNETKAPQGFNIDLENVTQEFKEGWSDVVSKRRKKVTPNPSVGIKSTPNLKGQRNANLLGKQKAATYVPKFVKEKQAPTTAATVRISDPSSSVVSKPSNTNVFKTPISFNSHKRRRPRSLLNSPVDVTKENHNAATMPSESDHIPTLATLVDVGVENDIQSAATPPVEPDPLAKPIPLMEVTPNIQQAS
ncbi:hypothetical protein PIB30_097662 [Stylosanthes scabra]|uniref:DUF4283 domain-containing protein n=1 Tax=Stylosanthes scabra TaxID=79078 RepID=A0ABU6QVP8_9FABA|nr:hypothetical protein [Stylosanthes scabra]